MVLLIFFPFSFQVVSGGKVTRLDPTSSLAATLMPADSTPFVIILQQSLHRETSTKAWCERCNKYQFTTQIRELKKLPTILNINACANLPEERAFWMRTLPKDLAKRWAPSRIAMVLNRNSGLAVFDLDVETLDEVRDRLDKDDALSEIVVYELKASVAEIRDESDAAHLVAQIKGKDLKMKPAT